MKLVFLLSLFWPFTLIAGNWFYLELLENSSYPVIKTQNSDAQLLDSLNSIMEFQQESDYQLLPQYALGTKGIVPLEGVYALSTIIGEAARRIQLQDLEIREISSMLVEEILGPLGLKRDELGFVSLTLWRFWSLPSSSTIKACGIGQKFHVERNFDIPYLAGYSRDGLTLYLDRNLPDPVIFPDGTQVSATPYLLVHEAFEKALMDLLPLKEKIYLRTHQLAQRLEKKCVEASALNWKLYDLVLTPEIDRADDPGNPFLRVPKDLDLTPYREYQDWALIHRMKKVMQ